MLNAVCTVIMLGSVLVLIYTAYNAIKFRMDGKVFTYTNLFLLNSAFYSMFTLRTLLFVKSIIPEELLASLIQVSPRIQNIINKIATATAGNFFIEAMYWLLVAFFVIAALIRGLTGQKSLRPGYIVSLFSLVISLELFGLIDRNMMARYETLAITATVLWLLSIVAVKIQNVIIISRKQKAQTKTNDYFMLINN